MSFKAIAIRIVALEAVVTSHSLTYDGCVFDRKVGGCIAYRKPGSRFRVLYLVLGPQSFPETATLKRNLISHCRVLEHGEADQAELWASSCLKLAKLALFYCHYLPCLRQQARNE